MAFYPDLTHHSSGETWSKVYPSVKIKNKDGDDPSNADDKEEQDQKFDADILEIQEVRRCLIIVSTELP